MAKTATFSTKAIEDMQYWTQQNPRLLKKLLGLVVECCRSPLEGKGKPEKLKGNLTGFMSRRIDQEHRLVYRDMGETIMIISCRGHYTDIRF